MKNAECRMRPRALLLRTTLFALLLNGCEFGRPTATPTREVRAAGGALPPTLERMRAAYPDLSNGRFLVLADFNSAGQELLFRVVGPDDSEQNRQQPIITTARARDETGPGGLAARLNGPGDRLIFDGQRSGDLALARDWREYALLIVSIFGPQEGATIEFSIQSGEGDGQSWTRTVFAKPGWSLLRFDIAELADAIDLADVRSLRWQATGTDRPIDLFLDDLILTDNTRDVLGPTTADGLITRTRGRRIVAGVDRRFELAFADGVMVRWSDGHDAARNLTVAGGLGPWPTPLAEEWHRQPEPPAYDDPRHFDRWGRSVSSQQRIVEAGAFRTVVRGEWRFLDTPAPPTASDRDARSSHTWTYTVYSSGQVFVRVVSNAQPTGWRTPEVGYALALAGDAGFRRNAPPGDGPTYVLLARGGPDEADFFCAPSNSSLAAHQLHGASDQRRAEVVCIGECDAADLIDSAFLLRIWPPDLHGAPEARSLAGDYQHPAKLDVRVGRRITDADGDLNADGFNESEGCYELAADGNLVRFRLDPAGQLRHAPVFRVRGSSGRDAWIYCEGRIVDAQGRDASGDLLFTPGRPISQPTAFDVNLRPAVAGE